MTSKLTLNLGVRWDYFGPINETNGGQANFVPYPVPGTPIGGPTFIIPASGKDNRTLSTTADCLTVFASCTGFVNLLAQDGITLLQTNRWGQGLLQTQKTNIAPRVGFAYQVNPKLVARGGFGLFFNSFENQGYGPNIGENYPFVFNLTPSTQAPPAILGSFGQRCAHQLQHRLSPVAPRPEEIQPPAMVPPISNRASPAFRLTPADL